MDESRQDENQQKITIKTPPAGPVRLTPGAVEAAKTLQVENPAYAGKVLRLYLDGKGCDGFYYGVTFDDPMEGDHVFPQAGSEIAVVVDRDTYEFVAGSEIDWVDDERGRGFLVENPRHHLYKGKFFKRKDWRQRVAERVTSSSR